MPEFDHGGWRLFFEDLGEGTPVLLLHGLFMDHTMFEHQVRSLSRSYRLITPDLRSHGRSEHRSEARTLWDVMEDQVTLLDRLGIERAVWGGASVAGPISLRAALRHPDRVTGLILISTQAGPEHPERLPLYEAFAETVARQGWTDDSLGVLAMSYFGKSAPTELGRLWRDRWRAQPVADVQEIMRSLTRRESLLDRLGDVRVPSLVVYGEEDGIALKLEEVEAMVHALPQVVEYLRIPAAGHSPSIEQPEVTTAAISRFLDRLSG
ncbi:MAG: alpha/beta hydrolase [Actinomycetota bacterium]